MVGRATDDDPDDDEDEDADNDDVIPRHVPMRPMS